MPHSFTLSVQRTARVHTQGDVSAARWWIVLHGYGQRAKTFLASASALGGAERLLIAPEALSRFYVDGMDEHREVGASWMTRAEREHEIDDYVAYLDGVVARLKTQREKAASDPPSIGVLGFSQGAATASRWAMLGETPAGPDGLDRLVLWAGDWAHDLDPADHADRLQALQVDLVAGRKDHWVPDDRLQALRDRLAAAGVEPSVHLFDGGHRLDDDTLAQLP